MSTVEFEPQSRAEAAPIHRVRFVVIGVVLVLALTAIALAIVRPEIGSPSPEVEAVETFFETYVDGGGRVVRHDQGGDTVSEGQAYALLLAAGAEDRERFEAVWGWTRRHLQRSDGLFAWRWQDGRTADREPASDADLDIIRALLVASDRFGSPAYRAEALRIADAIYTHETATFGARRLLLPGPWARDRKMINPSYLAPRVFEELATQTNDEKWDWMSADAVDVLRRLTSGGQLPPDWARVRDDGSVVPSGPPADPDGASEYGLEAPRTLLRLVESCSPATRAIAARTAQAARTAADGASHPVTIVGAAAAMSVEQSEEAERLLDRAQSLAERQPTYYGWALVAVGRIVLTSDALGACPAGS